MKPETRNAIRLAQQQNPKIRDSRVNNALQALKILTAASRKDPQDFRLLRCLTATAFRLIELDFKRIESYLTLAWIFVILREYSRAWQILLHADRVIVNHPAIQAGFECIQSLLKKPQQFQPVDMDAVVISFQFQSENTSEKELNSSALSWNALYPLLQSSLEQAESQVLKTRWEELQGAYKPLQEQVLLLLRSNQGDDYHGQ
jgi:hypothetical protein